MSLSNEITYYLIFDTNALFQAYEKKADFTTFQLKMLIELMKTNLKVRVSL